MKIHTCDQNSDEWLSLRAGKPTASRFSELITSKGEPSKSMPKYAIELAGELYAGKPLDTWNGNKFTEYGHEIEEEARLAYAMRTGEEVEQVGFITDDLEQWGCSPDGRVGTKGAAEFKCLPKEHIPVLLDWKKNNKTPTKHIAQTQGQILIMDLDWVDLVFYRPSLPMLIIRQLPDPKIIEPLKRQLMAVIAERNIIHKTLQEF